MSHLFWTGIPVGHAAWQGAIYLPCSQIGIYLLNSPLVITGMVPFCVSVKSPIRPPLPSSISHTCSLNQDIVGSSTPCAFSCGVFDSISCHSERRENVFNKFFLWILFKNSSRLARSQLHCSSEIGEIFASFWEKSLTLPWTKTCPPTIPTRGLWPRILSDNPALWLHTTAIPPAMNSPK